MRRVMSLAGTSLACLTLLVAAGCGSSSGGGSSNAAAKSSTAAASTPGVKEARAEVAQKEQPPKSIGVTVPLPKPPPAGKSILYLDNGTLPSIAVGDGLQAATKLLHWKYQKLDTGSSAQNITKAWSQAVQLKPSAVLSCGLPTALFKTQLSQLEALNIPYIGCTDPTPIAGDLKAVIETGQGFVERGQWMARWIVADSNGKAHTVLFTVPLYPVLKAELGGFTAEYKRLCPTCTLTVTDVSSDSIGTTLPGQVVSTVQRNPDINYIAMGFSDLTLGVPEALKAAGLAGKVQIVAQGGQPRNLQNIAQGKVEAAQLPFAAQMAGWMMTDAAARYFEGAKLPQNQYNVTPTQLFVKSNITNPNVPYAGPPGYQAAFEKLWQVK